MVGVKLGDRLLQVGCGDGGLLAALGAKVGLTGRACGVEPDAEEAVRARAKAEREGVLVEVTVAPYGMLPYDDGSFDIVAARDVLAMLRPYERVRCLQDAYRVLRPGGRIVVIEPAERGGIGKLLTQRSADPSYVNAGRAAGALRAEGFQPVRVIAEREGLSFTEGTRPNR
jgi:ubiquinone/menaquinone biosynthesis C-methylase UbiE